MDRAGPAATSMDDEGDELDTLNWSECSLLVTGGTGSFGRMFIEHILTKKPRRVEEPVHTPA